MYHDSLVKVIAAAMQTSPAAADTVARGSGVAALVAVLRAALATLRGKSRSRAVAVGNACVALTALSERHGDALLKAGACDLLVDALKAPGDAHAPIRRNASLAIARLVRSHAGCEARIRALRGMEILVTLQRDNGFQVLQS